MVMKECTKCGVQKSDTEFYKDSRNKSRTISHCKACVLKRQKGRIAKKYPVQIKGYKQCKHCLETRPINEFRINRTRKTGREHLCKECQSLDLKKKRRKKTKVYFKDEYSHLKADYHSSVCEICEQSFVMRCHTQRRCDTCSPIARQIHSSLITTRKGIATGRLRTEAIISISKRYIKSAQCCYCKQEFTEENPKSLDHIVPFIKGGTHDPENINISCVNCNMAKRDLDLGVWIDLCKRVAANNL